MPNWCYNRLTVTGDRNDLIRLSGAIVRTHDPDLAETSNGEQQADYDLTILFPIPEPLTVRSVMFSDESTDPEHVALREQYAENKAKYGHQDWYSWCLANWGTKWSPRIESWSIADHSDGTSSISAYYETAWSPATGLMRKVSELYPSLTFVVLSDEESNAFICCEAFKNGKVIAEQGWDFEVNSIPPMFAERLEAINSEFKTEELNDEQWDIKWEKLHELNNDIASFVHSSVLKAVGLMEHGSAS